MKALGILNVAGGVLLAWTGLAHAEYPERSITLVVPYGAGGATDLAARNLTAVTPEYVPEAVLVVNRTGAGGATGSVSVANAQGDGYTMLVARVGSHTVSPAMKETLPYSIDDFRYVGVFEINPVVCATDTDSEYKSMEDLVNAVKENPGKLTYSSSGVGSMLHISTPLVLDSFGIEDASTAVTHLPFRGGGEAATQVVAGNADLICTNSSALMGHIQSGALRPLLVTTEERLDGVDAPTVSELGHPELEVLVGWSGIAGPKGLEDEPFSAWKGWLSEISQDEEFEEKMRKLGSIPVYMEPEESVEFIKKQHNVFSDLVSKLKMGIQ